VTAARPAPCALTIAGLDPGGGAGIAADLRAFAAAGVFGCAAAAVLTIQSTAGLRAVHAVPTRDVLAQAREVLRHQDVRAIKVGALGTATNVRAVARLLAATPAIPAIVDPVISPTRGRARLLAERALAAMRTALLPRAHLVTANVPEAEALTGARIATLDDARAAAIALCAMGPHAALVKGGHMRGDDAVDVLAVRGGAVTLFRAKRLVLPPIHGGGCTLASLIAGRIAAGGWDRLRDADLVDAIRWARRVHRRALADARDVGGAMKVLIP
jgi:hydroxymethylpyrimidine/phosphomethylpyrimidine kinase